MNEVLVISFLWALSFVTGLFVGTSKGYDAVVLVGVLLFLGPLATVPILFMHEDLEGLEKRRVKKLKLMYCPYCQMAIPKEATRCGHCTTILPDDEDSGTEEIKDKAE